LAGTITTDKVYIFKKTLLYSLDGRRKRKWQSWVVKHEEVFGVDVKYFEGKVDFVQRVKLRGSAKNEFFPGTVEFMVCNDQQCLPPTTGRKFMVALN